MNAPSGLKVRRMGEEDIGALHLIWSKARLPFQPRGRDSKARIREQMSMDNCIFLMAELEGSPVGTVLVTHDRRKGWLNRLAVLPEHQGKGIGAYLVRRAEEELSSRGITVFAVQVHRHNVGSRGFFAAMGYLEHDDIVYCSKRSSDED